MDLVTTTQNVVSIYILGLLYFFLFPFKETHHLPLINLIVTPENTKPHSLSVSSSCFTTLQRHRIAVKIANQLIKAILQLLCITEENESSCCIKSNLAHIPLCVVFE